MKEKRIIGRLAPILSIALLLIQSEGGARKVWATEPAEAEMTDLNNKEKVTMTRKLTAILLTALLFAGAVFAQTTGRAKAVKTETKTARLHIDGFMKSKSGAV